jgi:hypothetical protein
MGLQLNETLALNTNRPADFDPMESVKKAQSIAQMIQNRNVQAQGADIAQAQEQRTATQFGQQQQQQADSMSRRNAILDILNSPDSKGADGWIDY